MTRNIERRGAATPASIANSSFLLRGAASLLLAIGAGVSVMALLASERPVLAQEGAGKFVQKDVADQLAKAESVVYRCDKANGRREIDRLKKTKDGLDAAAKSGIVEGAAADAKRLGEEIAHLEQRLTDCSDRHKFTGVNGETYGAFEQDDASDMGKIVEAAKTAAKNCDRLRYRSYVMRVRERANARMRQGLAAPSLYQLAKDLEAAAAELFKHCAEPGKAEAPKEPAKTGTGSAVPNQPPEPPKAPADSPDQGHGSVPTLKFNGEVFANVALMPQFGAGTAINGGRHSIVDSPGTLTGAGINFGVDIPTTLNAFGTGTEPWWSINIGFARATGRSSGELAPGAATTGFDYIQPNPASGVIFINHFLNGQIVYIDSERNQLDVEVLHNVKWRMTLNTMIPATPVEASAGVGFQFRAIWDSHQVNQSIINFPDVTSFLNLDSSTFFIAPKIMLRGEYEVGRFEFYVGAYFAPGLAIGSGRAEQHARCPVCAASEQSVNLSREDSFVKFAINTGARAWVSYEVTPAVKARAFVGYDYFSNTARWQLDPGNAYLKGGSAGSWRMGVGLNLRF